MKDKGDGYRSRKFILALIFTAGGTAAMLQGIEISSGYYWLAGLVLGAYGTGNVVDKHGVPWGKANQ